MTVINAKQYSGERKSMVVFCSTVVVFYSVLLVFCSACSAVLDLLLRPRGLLFHLLRPGGPLLCRPCPGIWLPTLSGSPCPPFASALPPVFINFIFIKLGVSGNRSLGGGLPFTHHQRSLAHHMDSCTTPTVAHHSGLRFPSSIALTTHTQLIALITHPT